MMDGVGISARIFSDEADWPIGSGRRRGGGVMRKENRTGGECLPRE